MFIHAILQKENVNIFVKIVFPMTNVYNFFEAIPITNIVFLKFNVH